MWKYVFTIFVSSYVRWNNQLVPTNTLILAFDTSVLLQSIKAGYLNIYAASYVPNPPRCFTFKVWILTECLSWTTDMCSLWSIRP